MQRNLWKSNVPTWIKWLLFGVVLILLTIAVVLLMVQISQLILRVRLVSDPSVSMSPTIPKNSYFLMARLLSTSDAIHRGEVIVFHNPDSPSEIFVKRVIGLPGDTIDVTKNAIVINGRKFEEAYIHTDNEYGLGTYYVPLNGFFVMGDNRPISFDSRLFKHPVTRSQIIGQALFIISPFNHVGRISQ